MKVSQNSRTDRIGIQTVGEQFERAGYIFREQPISDYGIDAQIEVVDGETPTGKLIGLQIKSGISWFKEFSSQGYIFRGDNKHLTYWIEHSLPVLIILHDIDKKISYWQAVKTENVIPTMKGWKILVPDNQRINPGMDVDLRRLVNKISAHRSYTICRTHDVSHGQAKRYSLRVILNKEHTQAEILSLIVKLTIESINCDYHRNSMARSRWGNKSADVVWLFIYPSAEDERNNNFICQTEWMSEQLSPDSRPISIGGEEISNGIKVKWNDSYSIWARLNEEHTISKELFIQKILCVADKFCKLLIFAESSLKKYENREYDFPMLASSLSRDYSHAASLYREGTNVGISPYECKRVSQKFQNMIAHAHNVYIFFGEIGMNNDRTEENIIFNVRSQLKSFKESEKNFRLAMEEIQ